MTPLFHEHNLRLKHSQQSLIRQVLQMIDVEKYCMSTAHALGIRCTV